MTGLLATNQDIQDMRVQGIRRHKDKIGMFSYLPNLSYIELHALTTKDIDHLVKVYVNKMEKQNNQTQKKL